MLFLALFPLLVMYFSMLRVLLRLPSQLGTSQREENRILPHSELGFRPRATETGRLGRYLMPSMNGEESSMVWPMRRSTRIRHSVQVRVTGVDATRGPFCEEVAADTISCHGFQFKWKYDVAIDSEVMLELNYENQQRAPLRARGVVKWMRGPGEASNNSVFHTAIQLKEPCNIWSVDSPPEDWLPFCVPANSTELNRAIH